MEFRVIYIAGYFHVSFHTMGCDGVSAGFLSQHWVAWSYPFRGCIHFMCVFDVFI